MAFAHGIRLRCVAMQLDRVRPIRAGRSRIRLGSETDLDEQIVSGAFRERQNSAPHLDNPRSECQHRMPHVRRYRTIWRVRSAGRPTATYLAESTPVWCLLSQTPKLLPSRKQI